MTIGITMMQNKGLAVVFVICALSLVDVEAKHYRGGTIYWSPVDDNSDQIKITYRLGFKLHHVEKGHDDCLLSGKARGEILESNGQLKCDECLNGRDEKITDLEYVCTDYDEAAGWAMGRNSVVYDAPGTKFNISYESCCWIDLVSHSRGTGLGWKLAAAIDLRRRPDTGRINSSPISEALPVQFMEKGCTYALQIPVIDPDNDNVRCRWPDMENECNQVNNGACGLTPRARLKQNDCTMRFDARRMKVGWHAVNLIIEDFTDQDSTEPLSKVSLQFLISVLDSTKCNKPRVLSRVAGTCETIPAEMPYEKALIVSVSRGRRLSSFTTMKPEGMAASEVNALTGSSTEFYTQLTWTPTIDQIGKHIMCFQASDNLNSPSAMTCMLYNVMAADSIGVLTAEPVPSNAIGTDPQRPQFIFSGEIRKPFSSKFITVLDSSGVEIVQIDVSKRSSDVTYSGRILEFGLPWELLTDMDSGYQLIFDAGIAKGAVKCGLESEPNEWDLQSLGYSATPPTKAPTTPRITTSKPTTKPTTTKTPTTIKPTTPKATTTIKPTTTKATTTIKPTTPKATTTIKPTTTKAPTTTKPTTPKATTTIKPTTTKIPTTIKPTTTTAPTTTKPTTTKATTTLKPTTTKASTTIKPTTPKATTTTKPTTPEATTTRRPTTTTVSPTTSRPTHTPTVAPTVKKIPEKIEARPENRAASPECFSSSMRFYVSKKIVGQINPIDMHFIDPSCRGEIHNETHYVIGTGYAMCGTTFQRGPTGRKKNFNTMGNIIYLPALPYYNGSVLSVMRKHNIEIHVNCTITTDRLTHVEYDPEVKTIIYHESGYGHFNFSLKMYRSDGFKTPFGKNDFPVDVNLRDRLYFQARSWARPGTELLLDSCRATPTANPFDEAQYTFIRDGCPIDATVKIHPIRFKLRKRFSVSAFSFEGNLMEESVFVHCDMRICDLLDRYSKCKRSCLSHGGKRYARDTSINDVIGNSSEAYQDTDGPIRFVRRYELEEAEITFNLNEDLIHTVLLAIVIILLIVLLVINLCRRRHHGDDIRK